ncbi:DHHC palmitoyltransferase-domain-containing protein [Lasiosphaeris hirsuta]|uniref:Palmitoyltransferase PFA4 n=1 Tax=Lasiosphaeris hirsuta TaxID=260670 RepID=A0AA40E929_9PEZI|nr:DHHC palmitoyltransferase-domain-containing protein [Lasiosphaeris hirsuta]
MSGPKTGPSTQGLQTLAIPFVCILVGFLGYYSQWLFWNSPDLAPGPLPIRQTAVFNVLLACVWWTYYRACTVDPGRYTFPTGIAASAPSSPSKPETPAKPPGKGAPRWCKKCQAPKPPRAHHCRHCGRCIPKMDHHCPWTGNCVSMQTFPYFFRFLLYTNFALWMLGVLVFQRLANIWSERHLPAYLGPTLPHLIALTMVSLVCAGTSMALLVLLVTTARGWVLNSTMIEDWEVDRHEAVLSRLEDSGDGDGPGSDFWGADGNSGQLVQHLDRVEFPYDLGVFANMAQGMGTRNPLLWFFPLAGGPRISTTPGKGPGWEWEENGFNDLPGLWPPPDPEKLRRAQSGWPGAASRIMADGEASYYPDPRKSETPEQVKASFAQRQAVDMQRKKMYLQTQTQRSGILAELEELDGPAGGAQAGYYEYDGVPAWTNAGGDRLWDYGVDEDVEEDGIMRQQQHLIPVGEDGGDDDVPIAELIRRRKVLTREADG